MKKLFPYWPVFATLFFIAIIVIVLQLCVISPISSSIKQNIEKAKQSNEEEEPDKSVRLTWRNDQNIIRMGMREKFSQNECEHNLKQISLAIHMYSQDNKGQYPDKNGAEGFEMLRAGGYLKNVNICTCPSTNTVAKDGEKLTEENVDYVYIGGYNESTSCDISIVYDKPTNHCKYGNILFADVYAGAYGYAGGTGGYAGANWMDNVKK